MLSEGILDHNDRYAQLKKVALSHYIPLHSSDNIIKKEPRMTIAMIHCQSICIRTYIKW